MVIFIMVFQFTLYAFPIMPRRRTAALEPFVKVLNLKKQKTKKKNHPYLQSYLLSGCGNIKLQSDYTGLPFAKLSFLLRCVKAGFWICTGCVVQLLYQLQAVIFEDQSLVKALFSPVRTFSLQFSCDSGSHVDKMSCRMPIWTSLVFDTKKFAKLAAAMCPKFVSGTSERRIILMASFQSLSLCNFDVQSVSLCRIHQREGALALICLWWNK